jgi:hypothetical protein
MVWKGYHGKQTRPTKKGSVTGTRRQNGLFLFLASSHLISRLVGRTWALGGFASAPAPGLPRLPDGLRIWGLEFPTFQASVGSAKTE